MFSKRNNGLLFLSFLMNIAAPYSSGSSPMDCSPTPLNMRLQKISMGKIGISIRNRIDNELIFRLSDNGIGKPNNTSPKGTALKQNW